MIEVTFSFNTPDEVKKFLAGLGKRSLEALPTSEAEPPAPTLTQVQTTPVVDVQRADVSPAFGAALPTPAASLQVPASTTVLIPTPKSAVPVPTAPAAPAVPVPAAPAAPADQATLISAFTALGNAKGKDGIIQVCAQFGASQVLGQAGVAIPQEKWADAIAAAKAATA